jgi:hypothetical protein
MSFSSPSYYFFIQSPIIFLRTLLSNILNSKISETACLTLLKHVIDFKISGVTQSGRFDYLAFARDLLLACKDTRKERN